jgi:hypothetical protein
MFRAANPQLGDASVRLFDELAAQLDKCH